MIYIYIKTNNPCNYWCMRPTVFEVITKPNTPTWALIFIAYLRFHTAIIYPNVGKLVGVYNDFHEGLFRVRTLVCVDTAAVGALQKKDREVHVKLAWAQGQGQCLRMCIKCEFWHFSSSTIDVLASWIWHLCCISKVVWIRLFVLAVLHFKAPLSRFISQHSPHHCQWSGACL